MKTKILSLILSLCLTVLLFLNSAASVETFYYKISTTNANPCVGDEFEVIISLTDYDISKDQIRGVQIDIANIDLEVFEVVSHGTMIDDTSAASNKTSYSNDENYIRFVYLKLSGAMDKANADLMKIRLKIRDDLDTDGSIDLPITIKIGTTSENLTFTDSLTVNYRVNGEPEEEGITWTIDNEGVLNITGSGVIPNYSAEKNIPWYSECENIKSVVINDGITAIGDRAFYKLTNLESISISNNVTRIGAYSFYKCLKLKSVTLPNKLTSIGELAFSGCSALESLAISDSVMTIESWAFYSCSSLSEVYYAGSPEMWNDISIGNNNDNLKNATIIYGKADVVAIGIYISTLPKTQYYYGEDISLEGMIVNKMYSDGSFTEIKDYSVTGYDKYSFGKQSITVESGEFTCGFNVYVKPNEAESLTSPVVAGMTVKEFSAPHSAFYSVYVFDNDKKTILSGDDIIKTGCLVQFIRNNSVVDSVTIVVSGDATGDGIVNGKDIIRIKKQILGGNVVEYTEFADINCDGTVDEKDLDALVNML